MLLRTIIALLLAAAPTLACAQSYGVQRFDGIIVGGFTINGVGTTFGTVAAGNDSRIVGATQNAAAAITGGTINGATIGGSTPAPATFTILSLTNPLALTQGGCGATSALGCLSNLGLAGGTANYVLTSNGPGTAPTYQPSAGGGVSSAALDSAFGSTQGSILYRGASAWQALGPGTSGNVLTTGGAGANPSWAAGSYTPPSGSVVNYSRGTTATSSVITSVVPSDDTVPQSSETTSIVTVTHTPRASANLLHVHAVLQGAVSASVNVIAGIFQASGASAVAVRAQAAGGNSFQVQVTVDYWVTAGTTSPILFDLRGGSSVTNNLTINGIVGARVYGGTEINSIEVTEHLP